jgi:hypothetical protein
MKSVSAGLKNGNKKVKSLKLKSLQILSIFVFAALSRLN